MAKAKKKRITSPIDRLDRLARDRAALAANPKVVELLLRQAAEKAEMGKVSDAIFSTRRSATSSPRRAATEPRGYRKIRELTKQEFPGGYENVSTGVIRDRVGKKFPKEQPVPSRDTFDRALGRRSK